MYLIKFKTLFGHFFNEFFNEFSSMNLPPSFATPIMWHCTASWCPKRPFGSVHFSSFFLSLKLDYFHFPVLWSLILSTLCSNAVVTIGIQLFLFFFPQFHTLGSFNTLSLCWYSYFVQILFYWFHLVCACFSFLSIFMRAVLLYLFDVSVRQDTDHFFRLSPDRLKHCKNDILHSL